MRRTVAAQPAINVNGNFLELQIRAHDPFRPASFPSVPLRGYFSFTNFQKHLCRTEM